LIKKLDVNNKNKSRSKLRLKTVFLRLFRFIFFNIFTKCVEEDHEEREKNINTFKIEMDQKDKLNKQREERI